MIELVGILMIGAIYLGVPGALMWWTIYAMVKDK